MHDYRISVTYTTEESAVDLYFHTVRTACSPGSAIAPVASLFTALSNKRYPVPNTDPEEYRPFIRVSNIAAVEL